ncbi:MAG: hypothetical protein LBM02_06555 [Lachnospiraceae bacterium]|jgi:uncharacterized membrane protein YkvI|nr:hypothetical protein [Lachnospiraceae bacterium]
MKDGKFRWFLAPFSVASIWFGIYIGPGFSGGAQLVSFFVAKSWLGVFIGPLITTTAAALICFFVLEYCRKFETYNFRTFYDHVYGKYRVFFANVKEFSAILACITISALSFATGGRLISQYTGLPFILCGIGTMAIIIFLILAGQSIVLKSSSLITVALVILIAYIGIKGVGVAWGGMSKYVEARTMNDTPFHVWVQIILYINIMVAFVDAAIPASKGQIRTRRDSIITAVMGFCLVFFSTIMMNIIFAAGMPGVAGQDLPTLWSMENVIGAGSGIKFIYTALAYLAVLSTGAGYLYGMVERYQVPLNRLLKKSTLMQRRVIIVAILACLGFYFGRVGIPQLVTTAYGIIGKINIPLFELPFLVILPVQMYILSKNNNSRFRVQELKKKNDSSTRESSNKEDVVQKETVSVSDMIVE